VQQFVSFFCISFDKLLFRTSQFLWCGSWPVGCVVAILWCGRQVWECREAYLFVFGLLVAKTNLLRSGLSRPFRKYPDDTIRNLASIVFPISVSFNRSITVMIPVSFSPSFSTVFSVVSIFSLAFKAITTVARSKTILSYLEYSLLSVSRINIIDKLEYNIYYQYFNSQITLEPYGYYMEPIQ